MSRPSGIILILVLLVSLMGSVMQAQIPARKDIVQERNDPYYLRNCNSIFKNIPLQIKNSRSQAVINYLMESHSNLKSSEVGLNLLADIESPGGRHLTFEQTYLNMPVFHSQVKVNLDKNNGIVSIFDNSWNSEGWEGSAVQRKFGKLDIEFIMGQFTHQRTLDRNFIKSRKVIAVLDDKPFALAEIELWDRKTDEHLLILTDSEMNIFLKRDLNMYRRDTASAMVFIPDPLTSAHVEYGSPYVDDSNRDVSVLNAQRMSVDIEVTFSSGMYKLENEFVVISEFSDPSVPAAESPTPSFNFTRAQTGFEDVNAFYHLTVFSRYVESLGFDGLVSTPVFVDAHALSGKEQSMFSYGFNGPQLFFGEGGVDDAEDADVVVHELGHALSFSASPNSNSGSQRNAVDEGIGDYLATSYSREIDTFRWADMFTWDGHNEYWNGRTADTDKSYPVDLTSSIHANGEIYCTALMRIWEDIGKEKTDRILLQSLYGLAANMTMKDAAMLLYGADSALYNGDNFCVIYRELLLKGLTDTFPSTVCRRIDPAIDADAGSNKTICMGDLIDIGNDDSYNDEYTYIWSPQSGPGSPFTIVTPAFPTISTVYTVEAVYIDGSYNTDSVVVNVLNCDVDVNAGKDVTICLGDTAMIGNTASFNSDYSYSWMPAGNLGSPLTNVTSVSPVVTTTYILKAELMDGSFNVDSVMVYVLNCDNIQVANSEGFRSGEDLVITFPINSKKNSIEAFDIRGRRILHYSVLPDHIYSFNGDLLMPGVYLLRLKAQGESEIIKVVKLR